jgi:vancomycin permeability regulator SanA
MRRKVKILILIILIGTAIFFTPQMYLILHSSERIFDNVSAVPAREYAIVFGSAVNEDGTLADVTKERIDATLLLFKQGKVKRLFISGDNRHNSETDRISLYASQHGVPSQVILSDPLGIDTDDTCRHFKNIAREAILVTQGFHLPRAISMCERYDVQVIGLAVEQLGLLDIRGDNPYQIAYTRASRFVREAALTWSHLTGLYRLLSNEAEQIEQATLP